MNYKQKYNDVLVAVKKLQEANPNDNGIQNWIDDNFPELKASDDERIRKNCIHFLELQKTHHAATFEIEECIGWLEKQGAQKPTWSEQDKELNKELITAAICFIDNNNHDNEFACNGIYKDDVLKWLKSLKQRIT